MRMFATRLPLCGKRLDRPTVQETHLPRKAHRAKIPACRNLPLKSRKVRSDENVCDSASSLRQAPRSSHSSRNSSSAESASRENTRLQKSTFEKPQGPI